LSSQLEFKNFFTVQIGHLNWQIFTNSHFHLFVGMQLAASKIVVSAGRMVQSFPLNYLQKLFCEKHNMGGWVTLTCSRTTPHDRNRGVFLRRASNYFVSKSESHHKTIRMTKSLMHRF